jgi:hypothetical protein
MNQISQRLDEESGKALALLAECRIQRLMSESCDVQIGSSLLEAHEGDISHEGDTYRTKGTGLSLLHPPLFDNLSKLEPFYSKACDKERPNTVLGYTPSKVSTAR